MQPDELVALVEGAIRQALGPVVQRVAGLEAQIGTYTKALEAVHTAPPPPLLVPVPGPPGPQGPAGEPGAPGRDGVDGKDGSPGLSTRVFPEARRRRRRDVGRPAWHANEPTEIAKPGDGSKAWQLIVKHGATGAISATSEGSYARSTIVPATVLSAANAVVQGDRGRTIAAGQPSTKKHR